MALGNFGGWGWGEARGGGGEREKPREGEEFLQLRSLIPAERCQGGPSQEHGMPSQTLLPFSLFRPFKNIRSILGEGGRKFPSPRPAPPHSQQKTEREKKIKIKKQPPNTQRPENPKRGSARATLLADCGVPRGGRERGKGGRRTGGGARALREPRQGPQELPNEHHATFPQSGRSPRLPLAPGRPAGRSARGEQLEPCLHSRSAEVGEKAAFHLAKNAPRRCGSSPSRPPRLFSRLPPLRVSPGRALSQGDFCPPRHRFPAALPAAQRGGAPAGSIPSG